MKWLIREEKGSVAVVVAICMCVLLGFTALAVDYGSMATCKQSLQNAADAAALAAARDLADSKGSDTIRATAADYARTNGVDPAAAGTGMTTAITASQVQVTLHRDLAMGFSAVLTGKSKQTVTASATAEVSSIFGNYPYALFAGQTIEDGGDGIITTGHAYVHSSIHSNSDISMKNVTLDSSAVATASGDNSISASNSYSGSITIDMPRYAQLAGKFQNVVTYSGSVTLKTKYTLSDLVSAAAASYTSLYGGTGYYTTGLTIYIDGDLTFKGNGSYTTSGFPVNLIVKGNISLGGCTLASTAAAPMTIISETGSMTVNGGGAGFFGILFAPVGDVTMNGNVVYLTGSVIAQNIHKNGNTLDVTYDGRADDFMPKTKVRLVE